MKEKLSDRNLALLKKRPNKTLIWNKEEGRTASQSTLDDSAAISADKDKSDELDYY